jgi:chromosomal replication initiation ATPase DnaA
MITEFAKVFCIPETEILRRSRKREIVEIRQLYWLRLIEETGFTYSHIGRISGFDHATVFHAVKAYKDRMDVGDMRANLLYRKAVEIKYPGNIELRKTIY